MTIRTMATPSRILIEDDPDDDDYPSPMKKRPKSAGMSDDELEPDNISSDF